MAGDFLAVGLFCGFAPESRIQLIESRQSFPGRATGREGAKAIFGVELDEADGGKLFHELIHTHGAMFREFAESGVFFVGQADSQGAHGSVLKN